MNQLDTLCITNMSRNQMDIAVNWSNLEGWNPGMYDADTFYNTDPSGYFMACVNGQPVGCISAVAYDDSFGFIGFFIVLPQYRGRRIGIELGAHALAYLGGRCIGIDGVESKVKQYGSHGFTFAYNNIRYEGQSTMFNFLHSAIVPVSEIPFEDIVAYDTRFFPVARPLFLSMWLQQPHSVALVMLGNNGLTGYGVIRPCQRGYKIAPLFADDKHIAEALFLSLISQVPPNSYFYIDIPQVNDDAVELVSMYSLKPVFRTARMYYNAVPDIPTENIFGVTSFELG